MKSRLRAILVNRQAEAQIALERRISLSKSGQENDVLSIEVKKRFC